MALTTRILIATLFFAFMPGGHSSDARREIASLKKSIRLTHAKELMGKHYQKSIVRTGEDSFTVGQVIKESVEKRLPEKWKKEAETIATTIEQESYRYEFDPLFLYAVIENESSFNPEAIGTSGEIGLMQILPDTAKWAAKKFELKWEGKKSLRDPVQNIRLGAAFLNYLRKKFDSHGRLYLAAYNMGLGAVKKALRHKIWPKDYPVAVMKRYVDMYRRLEKV